MQVAFSAFGEDNPEAPERSRLSVQQGDDAVQLALMQLGPVDALEDVQRRVRRLQDRRPPPASLRRSALRPRFKPVSGLPTVEDPMSASSTMVAYLLKPFGSPKDAERQLGPVGIIETSYRGASHSHTPVRVVIALEEPGATDPSKSGDSTPLGPFGTSIADRLKQRGVDLPVLSVERGNLGRHRWLMEHIARVLTTSRQRELASSSATPQLVDAGLLSASGLTHLPSSLLAEEALSRAVSENDTAMSSRTALLSQRSTCMPDALRWDAPPAAAVAEGASAEVVAATMVEVKDEEPPLATLASPKEDEEEPEGEAALAAAASSAEDDILPDAEAVTSEDMGNLETATLEAAASRAASLTAAVAVAKARLGSAVDAIAAAVGGTSRSGPSEVAPAMSEVMVAFCQRQQETLQPAAIPSPEIADPTNEAAQDASSFSEAPQAAPLSEEGKVPELAAPVVQVGDLRFCLPPPDLAVQRISQLWRPGATMIVITTQHYGTPLLCPDGDIMKGLVNIAPSAEGGQQLVPLFWQNVEEAAKMNEQGDGHMSGDLAGFGGGHSRMARGPVPLPTMVEEEEDELELTMVEEEEEEGESP